MRLLRVDHALQGRFHRRCLSLEIGAAAALCLGGVRRQLHAVDGKEHAPDQPLAVAHQQCLGEERAGLIALTADEMGDGGEVRRAVAEYGHEQQVVAARGGGGPRTDQAALHLRRGIERDERQARWSGVLNRGIAGPRRGDARS